MPPKKEQKKLIGGDKLLKEYEKYQDELEQKLGHKHCVVICEVGMFGEFYALNEAFIKKLSGILNIAYTKRNNSLPLSKSNPFMLGFPVSVLEKYADILLANNISVGFVEQIDTRNSGSKIRKMTQILTPETNIDDYQKTQDVFQTMIFVEKTESKRSGLKFYIGLSKIDISTGENLLSEMCFNNFKELENFMDSVKLNSTKIQVVSHQEMDNLNVKTVDSVNNAYICKTLEDVFGKSQINVLDRLNVTMCPNATKAMVFNLNYLFKINPTLLNGIKNPIYEANNTNVMYNSSLIDDIHVLKKNETVTKTDELFNVVSKSEKGTVASLIELFDKCMTNSGKRTVRNRLLKPTFDTDVLNNSYAKISTMIDAALYVKTRSILEPIQDPVRNLHRLFIYESKINILNVRTVLETCQVGQRLKEMLGHSDDFQFNTDISAIAEHLDTHLNFDEHYKTVWFKQGLFKKLDTSLQKLNQNKEAVDRIQSVFSELIGADNSFKLECYGKSDEKQFRFTTTSKRGEMLKLKKDDIVIHSSLTVNPSKLKYTLTTSKKDSHVTSPELDKLLTDYKRLQNDFDELQQKTLNEFTKGFLETYTVQLREINAFITDCDVYSSLALVSTKNCYYPPKIDPDCSGPIFKQIRHPIIEHNEQNYVENDVDYTDGKPKLIWALNASGKSSILRAQMVCVYLAQCGIFTACQLTYKPFQKLFTRIAGGDAMIQGLSTFDKEITEINYILKHLDSNTFLTFDELATGSEQSAILCINASLIQTAVEKGAILFLTSHCHELKKIKEIQETSRFYYMKTSFNQDGSITFHRKFVEGVGEEIYGLLCAQSILGNNSDFMKKCFYYQKEYIEKVPDQESICPNKRSRYNRKVIVGNCEVCGKSSKDNVLETHHITEQHTFNENNLNDALKKNSKDNLVILCSTHHDMIDIPDKLVIKGWKYTSNGRVLDYELN